MEDEVVRDLKKQLQRQGSSQARSFLHACEENKVMPRVSSHPLLQGPPMHPDIGRASDLAQPGGFRRHHVGKSGRAETLLNRLLDPRLQLYFRQGVLPRTSDDVGGSSNFNTVLLILKSTVGGTLIIIPGAFSETGLLLAPLLLLLVGGVEIYCMVLLVQCVRKARGSYGDLAQRAMGSFGSGLVDASVFLSQAGFVCAEMLYVAKNCSGALRALGIGGPWFTESSILLLQLLVVVPMSWIRELKYFQVSNFIANITVAAALTVLLSYSVTGLVVQGPGEGIQLAGPNWMVFTGTVAFSFECINFVIPMYDAHEDKDSFVPILVLTLFGVCGLFIVFGGVNYAFYGDNTQQVITLNMPQNSQLGKLVPFAFALASLFNVPLFLFPAALQLEATLVQADVWKANCMRALLTCACAFISLVGRDCIDAFIALIGSFCCVPLAFIFPVICHTKICQPGWKCGVVNSLVLLMGCVLFVYTSLSAVQQIAL